MSGISCKNVSEIEGSGIKIIKSGNILKEDNCHRVKISGSFEDTDIANSKITTKAKLWWREKV